MGRAKKTTASKGPAVKTPAETGVAGNLAGRKSSNAKTGKAKTGKVGSVKATSTSPATTPVKPAGPVKKAARTAAKKKSAPRAALVVESAKPVSSSAATSRSAAKQSVSPAKRAPGRASEADAPSTVVAPKAKPPNAKPPNAKPVVAPKPKPAVAPKPAPGPAAGRLPQTPQPLSRAAERARRATELDPAALGFKQILLPLDLSHASSWKRALPVAINLANLHNAQLNIVTVIRDSVSGVDWQQSARGVAGAGGGEPLDLNAVMRQASDLLDALENDHIPSEIRVRHIVVHGVIYKEILRVAKQVHADMIVMASNRPSLQEYLLGPNAERVIRHAECSVTVIRD